MGAGGRTFYSVFIGGGGGGEYAGRYVVSLGRKTFLLAMYIHTSIFESNFFAVFPNGFLWDSHSF